MSDRDIQPSFVTGDGDDERRWTIGGGGAGGGGETFFGNDLRIHLLKRWPPVEVDALMERRRVAEAARLAREAWEASLRGRITLRYRSIRREASERVRGAWDVLRHGVREDDY